MTEADQIVTLASGAVTVTVHPAAGARIGRIDVAGQPLLVETPNLDRPHPMMWGSFAMVPWAGRIRQGRFAFEGVDHQLPINHSDGPDPRQAHAIHGLAFDRPWRIDDVSDTSCECSIRLDWDFGGIATQTVAAFEDRVVVSTALGSSGAELPAEIGWHPWFLKPDGFDFSPTAMYQRDDVGLPTGALVQPTAGPWDDCFVNTAPVVLRYDRPTAPEVTVASDCDHWVVFDELAWATCVEPQSGPPDAFNLTPHLVTPSAPLHRTMTISW